MHPGSVFIFLCVVRILFSPFLPGTAFLLWYLFCPHMSGMYHGTTCGSQLYLPPRRPTGLQDSHHSAPGRCSARTTGYSSKILPTRVLYFPLLPLPPLPPSLSVTGQGVKAKSSLLLLSVFSPLLFSQISDRSGSGAENKVLLYEFCILAA